MEDKYLAGVGGGLILISFGIIISLVAFEDIEVGDAVKNEPLGFQQLGELKDATKETRIRIANNTAVEEFGELVGNLTDEIKDKLTIEIKKRFSDI